MTIFLISFGTALLIIWGLVAFAAFANDEDDVVGLGIIGLLVGAFLLSLGLAGQAADAKEFELEKERIIIAGAMLQVAEDKAEAESPQ